jgi:hypothetical protein
MRSKPTQVLKQVKRAEPELDIKMAVSFQLEA